MVSSKSVILIIAILVCNSAAAFAYPCPPKRFFCWQVRIVAAEFGAGAVENHVRACGWTELQIAIAKRCLK